MTLPDERTRAVIRAADFLTRLSSPYVKDGIKGIPIAVREEARRVLRHFPLSSDLLAAAQDAPEVFDAEAVLQHEPPNPPLPAPPTEPGPAFMQVDVLDVDPPSGWLYGFPKTWDRRTDPDMVAWLIKNGYPEEEARKPDLMLRFMSVPEEQP